MTIPYLYKGDISSLLNGLDGGLFIELLKSQPSIIEIVGEPQKLVELCTAELIAPPYDPDSGILWEHPDIDIDYAPRDRTYLIRCQHCGKIWKIAKEAIPVPEGTCEYDLDQLLSMTPPHQRP